MKYSAILKIASIGIILLSTSTISKANQKQDFIHTITYLGGDKQSCLDIQTEIKGNREGEVLIKVPQYLESLEFAAKQGSIAYNKQNDYSYLISLDPNIDFKANYRVCVSDQIRNNQFPFIKNGFFHFISEQLLIFPESKLDEYKEVKYQFKNFPEDYSIVTDHALNKKEYEAKDTLIHLMHSVIAGGNLNIKTVSVQNQPVHIIINGEWSLINAESLVDYLKNIIQIQRKFTSDNKFPYFVIIIFKDNLTEFGAGLSGSLYNNVLSMAFTDFDPKYKYLIFGGLSHELFHAWIGNKIKAPLPQGNLQWFFEGVNDFYGWQLALDSKKISNHDYINYYNRLLKEYTLSPYKEASNDEIAKYFMLRNHANRLAVVRAHLVFMEVLNKLNQQGKSRAILDAALIEIFNTYSDQNRYVSAESLDNIFRKHLGNDIWRDAVNTIVSGKAISFSSGLFNNKSILSNKEIEAPDFGFDLSALFHENRIYSLANKSNASLAGLKENAKVLQYGLEVANPDGLAYLLIDEPEGKKLIKFKPNTIKKTVPQYNEITSG